MIYDNRVITRGLRTPLPEAGSSSPPRGEPESSEYNLI